MLIVVNMTWREKANGKYRRSWSLGLCVFSVSLPPTTSFPHAAFFFIYLFSNLFLSLRLILHFSHSFFLLSWWQRLGCDPITGWPQQSPSSDWFYNPHSGSQMGENQLAKNRCSKAVILMHTHISTRAHARAYAQKKTRVHFSLHLYHTSWLHIIAFILSTIVLYECVCMCGGTAMIEQQRRASAHLKFCIWNGLLSILSTCL